jgi:hypothetical protein
MQTIAPKGTACLIKELNGKLVKFRAELIYLKSNTINFMILYEQSRISQYVLTAEV